MNIPTPRKVLHVIGGMNRGGAESLLMNILRNMNREKFIFDFAVHTDEECHFDQEIINRGGSIFHLPTPGILTYRQYIQQLSLVIQNNGPYAAVHSHVFNFSGVVVAIAQKQGVKKRISHSHTIVDGKKNSVWRNIYRLYAQKMIAKYSTMKIGCSREACESLFGASCWTDNRIQVIPNAIDSSPFKYTITKNDELKNELGIPQETILLGHVGRFSIPKNHEFLIRLFEQFNQRAPNAHLVLAGDGLLRNHIEQLVRTKKLQQFVHFLGVRSDIPTILASLDVMLLPSLHEGLPLVLIEAQAAGLPSVVANTVTKEADLELKLISYVNLNDSMSDWVDAVNEALQKSAISWDNRYDALVKRGFEIKEAVGTYEALYA